VVGHATTAEALVGEVAVKRSLGKLQAPDEFAATFLAGGAQPLPIDLEHAAEAERLPWHHRDPFHPLLIAQAIVERAALVSGDEAIRAYDARVVW
jgi:PIN domain nuclease of toxin-antitoxin system